MKKIRVENFRCFEKQEIIFADKINVLIGDNSSGKTSVLNACKYVLSAFFAGFSDENTKWINPSNNDFRTIVNESGVELPEKPIIIEFCCDKNFAEHFGSQMFDNLFVLQKNSKKNSKALTSGIKDFKTHTSYIHSNLYDKNNLRQYPLPVFSYFSTEDIHKPRKINSKQFLSYTNKPSFGYYECLEGNGLFDFWLKRLLALKEAQKNTLEIDIVIRALIDVLGNNGCNIIKDVHIRPNVKKVYFEFIDSREVEASLLSDGYKRLANIVIDIAFRCAILNRELFKEETAKKCFGTVIIDELDMHLHPALQTTIIKGLKNAFPNIQFIISTHAPMILSSIENNDDNTIHKLTYSKENGYDISEEVTYGKDASNIIETILDQSPRDINVNYEISKLFDLIDNDKLDEAKKYLIKMKVKFGDTLPELFKAETMINFLEISDNDKDN